LLALNLIFTPVHVNTNMTARRGLTPRADAPYGDAANAMEEPVPTTVLTDRGDFEVAAEAGLRLTPADAERITGWALKPEGMCRDALCVPWPTAGGTVDVAAFWRHIGGEVAADDAGTTWVLGEGADQRRDALASLEAPDFALPDLAGVTHRLSDLRGQKIFLTTWASW
jgi:hypothetical protein